MHADKSLARPASRCILFDGENIQFDASLVIPNIPPIMIINRVYETRNLLSLQLVSFLIGLRIYQHPCSVCRLPSPQPALLVYGAYKGTITGWRTKSHTIDCAHNTFVLLQKHLTPGRQLILIGWKIVPNEERFQCDHRFASQPLANEPLHSSQLFDTSLQKARGTT